MFAEDQSSVEVRAPLPWRAPVAALRCKSRPQKQMKSGKFCDLIDVARSHNHLAIAQKQSRTIIITSRCSYQNHLDALHPDMPLAAASSALSKFHILSLYYVARHERSLRVLSLGERKTPASVSCFRSSTSKIFDASVVELFSFLCSFLSPLPDYTFSINLPTFSPHCFSSGTARTISNPRLDIGPDSTSAAFEALGENHHQKHADDS
jgi:hypothetical protein